MRQRNNIVMENVIIVHKNLDKESKKRKLKLKTTSFL